MKRVIYKYGLPSHGLWTITMPHNSEVLSVSFQNDELKLWALVDTDEAKEERTFEVFQIGQEIWYDMGTERKFIGTSMSADHNYVVHVFERIN